MIWLFGRTKRRLENYAIGFTPRRLFKFCSDARMWPKSLRQGIGNWRSKRCTHAVTSFSSSSLLSAVYFPVRCSAYLYKRVSCAHWEFALYLDPDRCKSVCYCAARSLCVSAFVYFLSRTPLCARSALHPLMQLPRKVCYALVSRGPARICENNNISKHAALNFHHNAKRVCISQQCGFLSGYNPKNN